MRIAGYLVVAIVALCAGLGGGYVARDLTTAALLAAAEPALPQVEAGPKLLDVSTLVTSSLSMPAPVRRGAIAIRLDRLYVANGNEVFVRTTGDTEDILEIRTLGSPTRTATYAMLKDLDFTSLHREGFRAIRVTDGKLQYGYVVEDVIEWEEFYGPLTSGTMRERVGAP